MVESESDRLLHLGLEIVGYKTRHIQCTRYKKNLSRFRSAFGVGLDTVAQILNDLSQHEIEEEPDAVWLLIALNWIRVYNMKEVTLIRMKRPSESMCGNIFWPSDSWKMSRQVTHHLTQQEMRSTAESNASTAFYLLACRSNGFLTIVKPMMVGTFLLFQSMVYTVWSTSLTKSPAPSGIRTSSISRALHEGEGEEEEAAPEKKTQKRHAEQKQWQITAPYPMKHITLNMNPTNKSLADRLPMSKILVASNFKLLLSLLHLDKKNRKKIEKNWKKIGKNWN
jgi:hypothetical protein